MIQKMNKFILFTFLACVAVVVCAPVEEVAAPENIKAEAAPIDLGVKPHHDAKTHHDAKPHHDAQTHHETAPHHDVKHQHEEKKVGDHKKPQEHQHHEGGHLFSPEEKKRLLEVFGNLTKEQQDACDKKSWEDEHKNYTEEEKAAWKKLNETEKEEKKMVKWNAKSDEEKACAVHKREEFAKKRGDHGKGGRSGEPVTPEEKKRLLEIFDKMAKDQKDVCDTKSWKGEFKNLTAEEITAWKKMNETERKEKKDAEWSTKSDEEKACIIHRIEEMKKKMMGGRRGEDVKRRGDEFTKRVEGNKKQRGEQDVKKSSDANNKRRGSDKN